MAKHAAFWWISLAGSLCLLIYVLHRKDPVFLVGVSINTAIYLRNRFERKRAG